jgi:hypothetical protein
MQARIILAPYTRTIRREVIRRDPFAEQAGRIPAAVFNVSTALAWGHSVPFTGTGTGSPPISSRQESDRSIHPFHHSVECWRLWRLICFSRSHSF